MLLAMLPGAAWPAKEAISTLRLMPATVLATEVRILDSGRAGPVVLIVAGIHGDEPAGMAAAKKLATMTPARGKLIVLPVANRPAAESAVRYPYYLQDLNRAFPGRKAGTDTERLAASIMGLVARYRPAVVLDLHEAGADADPGGREIENTLILSEGGQAAELALALLEAVNPTRGDKPFSYLAGAPAGSLNREVARRFNIPVITVETSRRDPLPQRIDTQVDMVTRLLGDLGMLEGGSR